LVEEYAKQEINIKQAASRGAYLLHAGFLLALFFDTEDGGKMFFENVGLFSVDLHSRACSITFI
jgi:hypothetical protein